MDARFAIRALYLGAPIKAPRPGEGSPQEDGTLAVFRCKSEARPNDLEPPDSAHFAALAPAGEVPQGRYLFLQGIADESPASFLRGIAEMAGEGPPPEGGGPKWAKASGQGEKAALIARASRELWLESLWLEAAFESDEFFLRLLDKGGKGAFQLFRAIKAG